MSAIGPRVAPRRVGHKGAAHLAPGNTLASFAAAVDAGVDMIEFDVLSERPDGSGRLLLAHDYHALAATDHPLTLQEGLSHLASDAYAGIELDVDVKLPGYGPRVVAALREAGLTERALVSSTYPADLDAMRALEPSLRVGWSLPRARRDYTESRLTALPALALLAALRAWLPRRARAALRAGRFDAIMAHWRLVTPALVRAVGQGGGELYAWTVDDAATVARLSALGVHGIITNDPRLFTAAGG
ncbi:MAG TPA: glycerophosphodiester phosphodiesterase [Solirubrobacteraceae bacterium]|nr:glycerophosphodiester phosphodiesterase [Solirubrobacteraceae bacterium]